MTGKEASSSTPEGLNTLSVTQSSDISGSQFYGKENEFSDREVTRRDYGL
jgi:hypothetical protein